MLSLVTISYSIIFYPPLFGLQYGISMVKNTNKGGPYVNFCSGGPPRYELHIPKYELKMALLFPIKLLVSLSNIKIFTHFLFLNGLS